MANTTDPVGDGLVASLARPGGNVTGLSSLGTELNSKRLEILKDGIPKLARVGLLRGTGGIASIQLKEIRPVALALKLKLEEIETQPKGLESAFQTAKQKQVGAIMPISSRSLFAERKRIVDLAGKYRLPAIYFQKEFVDEGGLMSYGVDFDDLFRKAAHYVDKILKGTKPADLPVQQATKFEFVINLKAAKQIGLTLSPDFLARANQVIMEARGMRKRGEAGAKARSEQPNENFILKASPSNVLIAGPVPDSPDYYESNAIRNGCARKNGPSRRHVMENIALDGHKHYSWVRVENLQGQHLYASRLAHARGCFKLFVQRW